MLSEAFTDGWGWWVIAIAIGVPVLLVVLTELINTFRRRHHPIAGPLRLLRNAVVPLGALFALLAFAMQSPAEQVWVRIVATLFGFVVILLVLSAFNVVLFTNAERGTWRERIPTIFVEIARLVLVVLGLGLLFSWVWDADVGGLFTALGVGSVVIGLALQNSVGGIISGLLLLFEQPFKIGDHLTVNGTTGRVVEVNWRAVHIDTGSGIQIVPNSSLSGASFTNLSEPSGPYSATASVTFATDDSPHEVMRLLAQVAQALPTALPGEVPSVQYAGKAAYTVSIPVAGPADAGRTLSLFLSWLWYAARRHGFALDGDATDPLSEPASVDAAVQRAAPVLHLGEDGIATVRADARLERYGAGETVQPLDIVPDEVRVILEGRARMVADVDGGSVDVGVAEAGELIGQTALTRERTQVATVADGILTVLVLPLETVDALVRSRPRLAQEIGQSLEVKRKQAADALSRRGLESSPPNP